MAQRTNIIATVVPTHEIGMASSVLALARNISGAFGIAVFSTILTNVTNANVLRIANYSTISSIANQAQYATALSLITLKAQTSAYDTVFVIAAAVLFVGAILALFIQVSKKAMANAGEVHVE